MEVLLILLIVLLIWVGCAVATAVIARNKGRNGCIWLAIGIVLGAIGLIIALIVPRSKDG